MKQTKMVVLVAMVAVLGCMSTQAQVIFKASVSLTCITTNADGTKFVSTKITNKDLINACASAEELSAAEKKQLVVVWNEDNEAIEVWLVDVKGSNVVEECSLAALAGDFDPLIIETTKGDVTTDQTVGFDDVQATGDNNLPLADFVGSMSFKGKATSDDVAGKYTSSIKGVVSGISSNGVCTGKLSISGKGLDTSLFE